MADRSSGWAVGPVTVRAPASSANLGPGFDSFGLCLDLADLVTAQAGTGGTEVTVSGAGERTLPRDDGHLVVATMRRMFDDWGLAQPGIRVDCRNAIPQGRGLGSSAAAIVAGVLLARELAGPAAPDFDPLGAAADVEGHPDNVAACLLGGLTIAWSTERGPGAVSLAVDQRVQPVVFSADADLATEVARGLLPERVPHRDAAANAARSALLVVALTDRPDLLLEATRDLLHQEPRRTAMPASMRLVDRLRAEGIAAVLSGAGPSVLALCTADQIRPAEQDLPPGWRPIRLAVDTAGATVLRP